MGPTALASTESAGGAESPAPGVGVITNGHSAMGSSSSDSATLHASSTDAATVPDMPPASLDAAMDATTRHLDSLRLEDDYSDADTTFDTIASSVGDNDDTVAPLPRSTAAGMRKYHRHISRSAAKRQSVSALPSIKSLKQQWSSGGHVEHRAGAGVGIRPASLSVTAEDEEADTRRQEHKPWKEVKLARVAPAEARREASELLERISELWGISPGDQGASTSPPPPDVADLLVKTARAVRRVRSLNLAAAPPGQRRVSAPLARPHAMFSTPSRPSGIPNHHIGRIASSSKADAVMAAQPDPSAPVRRAALDLLGQLRNLEERLRVQSDDSSAIADGEPLAHPDTAPNGSRRLSSASFDDYAWSDEDEYNINEAAREAEMARSHEPWEERLLSEGRVYREVQGSDWAEQSGSARKAVRRWVEVVEGVFREGQDQPTDAWVINESGSDMERLHAFLVAHLEPEHVQLLPPASEKLLECLSDGYLLIQAYNGSLATSTRPWGFILPEDVHDTLEEQGETGREWTFRRAGNLTCWAAALRLRYNLPISMPATSINVTPLTIPTESKTTKAASLAALGRRRQLPTLEFDPLLVAKRAENWESMLQSVLIQWINEAAREVKGERVESGSSAEGSQGAAAVTSGSEE